MKNNALSLISLLVLFFMASTFAQTDPPAPRCDAPEYRQFDFWAGEWEVSENGKLVGKNKIEKILDGCALLESWSGQNEHRGHSLNFYDSSRGLWHQTWIDVQGLALELDGKFADGKMTLSGTRVNPYTGVNNMHRISWTPLPSGDVRQLWETSVDGGKSWQQVFDGLYSRKH